MITVREATFDDAEPVIDVVRKSITLSCPIDHRNDPYSGAAKLRFGVLQCYPYEKMLLQPN